MEPSFASWAMSGGDRFDDSPSADRHRMQLVALRGSRVERPDAAVRELLGGILARVRRPEPTPVTLAACCAPA